MTEFRTLALADAIQVAERMRERDWECLRACSVIERADLFALNRWQTDGPAWTVLMDGQPAAMGGISMAMPWIGVCWLVATDGAMAPAMLKKLLRHARTVLRNASEAIPRIEAHVLGTWTEAARFAERLGFELEGTRRRAGRDGQDVLTYVYEAHHHERHASQHRGPQRRPVVQGRRQHHQRAVRDDRGEHGCGPEG